MGFFGTSGNINSTLPEIKLYSWRQMVCWIVDSTWKKLQSPLFTAGVVTLLLSSLFIRRPNTWIQYFLRWPFMIKNRKNIGIGPLTDLLEYGGIEWKGGTAQAEQMRKAYEDIYWVHNIKHLRKIRGDNYCALRAVLFQILSQGLPLPSWIREQDVTKIPEKVFTQGCNWVQQYSFGPEKYTGNNVFGKLRKYLEFLKVQWINIHGIKDQGKRIEICMKLFSDQENEYKIFEAIKFLMLYVVVQLYDDMKNGKDVPNFCFIFFARDSSPDPLSFMLNHLNCVGDTGGLEQIEMFLLGFTLHLKIRTFRLYKYGTEEFQSCYPVSCHREWHEVLLLTEDDRHYNVPIAWS
ncbi:inactive ubiquitin thioesterase OTULINL-like [Hemiscyllium ocellatum]|uniref:inactive ubiquitin thioesterase OTULINL-like n=1 Tax=Hemiscyllium ocellatum TaxID=170820 RepID=UPI00296626AC|nr:inactive ubiquitin thioesterase OTULINL-like [Hemiscyllium ocellatum]